MRKEIKTYEVVCDCCGTPLHDTGVRTNGMGYEEPYLIHGDIDLCYACAGKIMYRDIVKKIPEEKLREFIESLKSLDRKKRPGFSSPELDIMLFKENSRNEVALGFLDEDVSLEVQETKISKAKPITFLSDL